LDLTLIDYEDGPRAREKCRNVYEVTEEFYFHNGHYGTREDVVFLINGIPVLVIECKNAARTRRSRSAWIRFAAIMSRRRK
jgi:type I restriction enzyme, R subunit